MSEARKFKIIYKRRFEKDYALCVKRGYRIGELDAVIKLLENGLPLPGSLRDHALIGDYNGCRDLHIRPDWLLIYRRNEDRLELVMLRTGTHSDLFN